MKKRIIFVSMVVMSMIVFGVVSTSIAADNKFLLSLGGGVFTPGSDASDYNQSTNISLSGTWTASDMFALGVDINHNKMDFSQTIFSSQYTSEVETTSLEFLFYIQPNAWKVQPYIALGFGDYFNTVTNKWGGATVYDSSGSGFGVVVKGGVRAFIGDNFFIGAYAKYFTNNQEVKYIYWNGTSTTETYDIGGTVVNAEIGFRF